MEFMFLIALFWLTSGARDEERLIYSLVCYCSKVADDDGDAKRAKAEEDALFLLSGLRLSCLDDDERLPSTPTGGGGGNAAPNRGTSSLFGAS